MIVEYQFLLVLITLYINLLFDAQVMSREDVQHALRSALKLQAGKHDAVSAGDTTESSAGTETTEGKPAEDGVAPTAAPRQQIILSQWALDTALSAALNVPTPRLGRPVARSKEDINALVTDKHERSLIGNVISPQNIGVTYDMIGACPYTLPFIHYPCYC